MGPEDRIKKACLFKLYFPIKSTPGVLFSFIASLGFDFISFGAQREKYRCKFTEENHFEPYEI